MINEEDKKKLMRSTLTGAIGGAVVGLFFNAGQFKTSIGGLLLGGLLGGTSGFLVGNGIDLIMER